MYFYEHENGEIIQKPDIVVGSMPDTYFDSPFVKRWWWESDAPVKPVDFEFDESPSTHIQDIQRMLVNMEDRLKALEQKEEKAYAKLQIHESRFDS